MLAILLCVAWSSATTGDEAGAVSTGVAAYYSLDFAGAIATLEAALREPELGVADRREALAFLGRAYASVRQAEKATTTFVELLALDPAFTVSPTESPLIQEALRRAQAAARTPTPAAQLTPTPAPTPTRDTTVVLAPPPDAATPFWESSLPWLIAGGVVIVAGSVLALTRPWQPDAPPAGSLGTWSLP